MRSLTTIFALICSVGLHAQDFEWAKPFGSTWPDQGQSIAIDASGNVYTTGYFQETVDFDPGTGTTNLTSAGRTDIFVQKMDASGNFLWAKSFGGTSYDHCYSITVDSSGDVYTTGYFQGTVDFEPGAGTTNLTSAGAEDIFVQKMDALGNFLWAKSFGGTSNDYGLSITVDSSGNVYTTGSFQRTVDFDPGAGTTNLISAGGYDIFVQKMDASGNFLWAKSFGGTSYGYGQSITVNASGNVYTTGYFFGTVDFDPGAGTTNLTSAGAEDIFIQKMDASGNFLWAKSFGGTSYGYGQSITLDSSGNVYTTGYFSGTVDFDPGTGTTNLASAGGYDIFVQKMDVSGNFLWAKSFGGILDDRCYSITVDTSGNVYTTGSFQRTVDFDPGAGTTNLTSVGRTDIFVQKLSPCQPTTGTDTQTACNSFAWIDGNTYTASNNTATHTLTNAANCDSVVTLDLTINNSNTVTDTQVACNTYTWPLNSTTYTTSTNTPTVTITNAANCDSVVTLNLTINNSNTGTDTQVACNTYTWPLNSTTYTASTNTPTVTLTNAANCDSVVTLDLTINTVDITTTSNHDTITANATGSAYRWLACDNNYSFITGETNVTYIATANGNYAVEITQNNCVDTSACVSITTVGLAENSLFSGVSVYPNPNKGLININLGTLKAVRIKVMDATGKEVYIQNNINTPTHQVELTAAKGIYFMQISTGNDTQHYKIIKE